MESEPTSTIASQPLSALPFTTRLQEFHRALSNIDWERDMPGCLFIRDYENLPTSASFDIDMMADEGVWKTLEAVFSSIAEQNELICMSRTSPSGLFILLFDVHKEADRRGWAYYEVRKELPFIKGEGISAREIEISCESGLPLPSKQWQFLLFLHQGLRKGKVAKYRTVLQSMLDAEVTVTALCEQRLGLSHDDIREILATPDQTEQWREKTGIRYAVGKKEPVRSRLSELKQKLARKFYILHTKGPVLFTLHGPDGVGKTTITDEISSIFIRFPFSYEVFHHISSWKHNRQHSNNKTPPDSADSNKEARVPLWRKILRVIYRNLSPSLRGLWIYSSNYCKYSSNLNRHILDRFYDDKIMICDRYIYDLWAKERVEPGYLRVLHPLHYLHCRALRRPKLAFVINDDPNEIYKRKQELTPEQIAEYQEVMDKALKGLGVPTTKVLVSGRKPPEIAREISTELIKAVGPNLFNLVRSEATKRNMEASF